MPYEIERKYLVKSTLFRELATASYPIAQGYICNDVARSVRIRKKDSQAYITIKGESTKDGLKRLEWEKPLDHESFEVLWPLCLPDKISKTRYEIPHGIHLIEVDIFHEGNEGLIIAEIELISENDIVPLPDWIGEEVTGDPRYYNAQLALHPYKMWASNV